MSKHASINKLFRLVWSDVHQAWVAVAENTSARSKSGGVRAQRAALLAAMAAVGLASFPAWAAPPAGELPSGGQVVAGQASIGSAGNVMNIDQGSQRAAIDWNTFNVGSAAQVNFNQPSSGSVTLNRVLDNNPSQIAGSIMANGQVVISNPNGVLFTPTARVDVGALTATTHHISNADFMAGLATYSRNDANGSVVNQGRLQAALGGYIALLAPEVRNEGVIVVQAGTVALAAGEVIKLEFGANNTLAGITATPSQVRALVENKQAIYAPGGLIVLSARAVDNLQGGVVKNSGTLSATSLSEQGGRLVLDGDQVQLAAGSRAEARGAAQGGRIHIKAGALDAAGLIDAGGGAGGSVAIEAAAHVRIDDTIVASGMAGKGGGITLTGRNIVLGDGAKIAATGQTGGGAVLVGGEWQGGGELPQAMTVDMKSGATIDASATGNGDGGTVVLWSDVHGANSNTTAHGRIFARGGAQGGNGGKVETSGHTLHIGDDFRVDTSALNGRTGEWLLDPVDFTVSAGSGSWTGSGIGADTLSNALNSNNVTIATEGSSDGNGDINVNAAVTKSSGGTTTLTLKSHRRLNVNNIIRSTSGALNVVLWSDYENTNGGGVSINSNINTNGGHLWAGGSSSSNGYAFWNGLMVGNGPSIGAAGANANAFDLAGSIDTAGGDVLLWAGAGQSVGREGIGLYGNRSINTGNGNITLLANQLYNWDGTNGTLSVNTTGKLTLAPGNGGAWANDFNWAGSFNGGNFTLNNIGGSGQQLAIQNIASLRGLTIGQYNGMAGLPQRNTGAVNIDSNIDIAGPLEVYGSIIRTRYNAAINTSRGNGDVLLEASGAGIDATEGLTAITAGSGNVTVRSDWVNINYDPTKGLGITTTGTFTFAPYNTSWTNIGGELNVSGALSGNTFTGISDVGWLRLNNVSNLGGLTLGKDGNGSGISTETDWAINGSIRMYGSRITVGGNLASNAANGEILLKAANDIIQSAGKDVITNGGSITYWADSDNNGSGRIELAAGTVGDKTRIATNGGNITLGGGSDPLFGYAWGTGGAGEAQGIHLAGYSELAAGSGSVLLRGASSSTADQYAIGVRLANSASISGGNISVLGTGSANAGSYGNNWGVSLENGSSITGSGGISVTGVGGGGSSSGGTNFGVYLSGSSIIGTGGGAMTISGTGGGRSGGGTGNKGVYVYGGSTIRSGAGTMTLIGAGGLGGSSEGIAIESSGGQVNTLGGTVAGQQSGNITLQADTFWFNPTSINQLVGTGTATIESRNASFNGGFSTAGLTLGSGLAGLRIGRTTNTADVTLASAASVGGPVAIYGGNIAINAALTATGGHAITLQGRNSVTDGAGGSLVADRLALLGDSITKVTNVTLDSASNAIGTLAAKDVGSLTYVNSNALTIGTVGSAHGINATGAVNIATLSGDLTVAQSVATSNATANALVLNAGRNASAGTAAGGNIIVGGAPTIAVGAGGTARLYTGGIAGSSGLTALVGSGSGRFRYYSDEAATNYTLALASGLNAIYRERPSVTVGISDQSLTYGTAPTHAFTLTGGANGDTALQALAAPAVTVGGATSTSGHATVGTHSLTLAGGVDQLGYNITNYTGGTLTVTPKQLTVAYTGIDKAYDGTTAAAVATTDNRVSGDLLTIARTAAFADRNVGNNIAVDISDVGISGADAGNYTLAATSGTTTAKITPKVLTISGLTVADKTYDGRDFATVTNWGGVSTGVGSETLTLAGTAAAFANANAGENKTVTASGYALGDGDNGGLASNYQLSSLTASTTATIDKALLTVIANDDAKFVVQADAGGYNGVSYSGFANGETADEVLGGTVQITRTNSGVNAAGIYRDVLVADTSNLTAANYRFQTQDGDYTIVGSNQLLVRVQNGSATYGSAANHTITSVEYMDDGNTIYRLDDGSITGSSVSLTGGNEVDIHDGAGGSANFALTPLGSDSKSSAGLIKAGAYQLDATGITTVNAGNFSDTITVVGSHTVTQKLLTATASGVSKEYDGTAAVAGVSLGLTGLETGDTVTGSGNGSFGTRHAGNNIAYTISGIVIGGADAGNYYLSDGASFAGNDGTITPRRLTATAGIAGALTKTYDGTTDATGANVGGSVAGAIDGDVLSFDGSGYTLAYNSAHVASANSIAASGTAGFAINTSEAGSLASDYVFEQPVIASASAAITPKTLTASMSNTGVTKIYDGNTSAPDSFAPTWVVDGLIAGDTAATLDNTGIAYDSKDVATASKLTVSGMSISGITGGRNSEASDYVLDASSKDVAASITPTVLTVTYGGVDKVYDGNVAASVTTNDDRIAGDVLEIGRTAVFADKNVGAGKAVSISGVMLSGADAGNYTVSASGSTTAGITRLDSVTWIGGSSGDWLDPANWAGGAVPDLSNVAHVVIPAGVDVVFGGPAVAPAESGPVNIDGLGGAGGGLTQIGGILNIGDGGMTLADFSQSGGALTSSGGIVLDGFTQTGGSTSTLGDMAVNGNFSQGEGGSLTVGGNAVLRDKEGGMQIGNLAVGGNLDAGSTAGDITQANGTAISVGGTAQLNASGPGARILLASAGNHFTGGLTLSDSIPPAGAIVVPPPALALSMPTPDTAPPEITSMPAGSAAGDSLLTAAAMNDQIMAQDCSDSSGELEHDEPHSREAGMSGASCRSGSR